ncbi:SDR family NAD(P)-dependent oxidoreductase [Paenibacillus xerothermodurans]|uniref:SDR family NAD(P)-dependent oxidoreductase n=1 Tax=Paenibacillus xerothermodurans TaxID=1977292 RepID=A0A2W1NRU4_PAEXE|nr:glucose 1-dehydrogenase [Paenibacillus xerothermodurans]PZE22275.1 SDR family NAD(P)-dependent oxidoreductase [Paenibacillus xerothermodurans]
MANRLAGKVVIITGGTKGIGKGIAYMAAGEGAKVVISGRNAADGERVTEEIRSSYGAEAHFVQGDIGSEEGCRRLIAQTVERFGRVDGLVNNAGIFPRGTMLATTEELYDSIFAVNAKAPFFCSKYAIEAMQSTGGGSIVHMGSTHGYKGGFNLAAYGCSKGMLRTLSRHIAAHYAKDQIRSNWVTVGWVASEGEIELHENMGSSLGDLQERAKTAVPSGRMQTAEDMAYGVVYLLSDESNQVTGSELAIAGGLNM